ncbi:MAG: prenyltransferase/squalene oxidase repeat-containing protein [Anaerolineae bacterium]
MASLTIFKRRTREVTAVLGPVTLGIALGLGALLALLALPAAPSRAAPASAPPFPDQRLAAIAAVNWLVTNHQNDDGGYSSFSAGANQNPSDVGGTLDAMLAIAASGNTVARPFPGKSKSPVDYLRDNITATASYAATDGGQAGKLVMALVAANQDPRNFVGHDFVLSVTNHLSPTGQFNVTTAFRQSLAMMGLSAVSETVPVTASQWLLSLQAGDGSWDDGFGTPRNADTTAMALMALLAGGAAPTDTPIVSATNFLSETQLSSGGWEYGTGLGESVNSTALVLQALSALGEDFYTAGSPWAKGTDTPLTALLNWQSATGAFQADFGAGRFDNFFSSVQAIPAATGKPYPLPGRYEAARHGLVCLDESLQKADGGWDQFADTGFGGGEPAAGTSRAIQAIASFGQDPTSARWTQGVTNAVQALEGFTPAYIAGGRGGRTGIVMQGVVGAAKFTTTYTVTNFAGHNLVVSMTTFLDPASGEYDDTGFGPFAHAEAMLGLIEAGFPVAPTATTWLQNAQTNGSWGAPDSDGISLQVLGRLGTVLDSAIFNARLTQLADGGWTGFGSTANPSSTSEMVQGLARNGQNPFDPSWSKVVNGRIANPADVVMAQQQANGCWLDFSGSVPDPFSTTDAILLLTVQPDWPGQSGQPVSPLINHFLPLISKS